VAFFLKSCHPDHIRSELPMGADVTCAADMSDLQTEEEA
jgi:hypothetical protein